MTNSTRFRDRQYISGGRFSRVYKATDTVKDRFVALKVTTPDDDRPPHNSRDEVKLLKELNKFDNPHIIQLFDSFIVDLEDQVMVFPYYPYTLKSYLKNHSRKNVSKFNSYANLNRDISDNENVPDFVNNLPLSKALNIVLGIASGLQFLHSKGVIHRDIKPENVLFLNYDPNPILIDFGISFKDPDNFGKESPLKKFCEVSTSVYRAPELIFGLNNYSYGIDIWSFGMLITLVFSRYLEPCFKNDDYGDFRLVSLIFDTFGTPNLETWPEAKNSSTFTKLNPQPTKPKSIDSLLPRANSTIKEIFGKMMVYESSQRISANEIYDALQQSITNNNTNNNTNTTPSNE